MSADPAAATPPQAGTAQMSGAGAVTEVVGNSPDKAARDLAQQAIFEDVDALLARLQHDIAGERAAMDALLLRLTSRAV